MHYQSKSFDSVVLIRVSALGDIILGNVAIKPLRNEFLSSKIVFILAERYKDLLAHNRNVDSLLSFDDRKLIRGFLGILRIRKVLSKTDNLLIDLHPIGWCPARSRFWAFVLRWFIPAKRKIRIRRECFSSIVKNGSGYKANHVTKDILNLLSDINVEGSNPGQLLKEAFSTDGSVVLNDAAQKKAVRQIGIHPGASFQTKQWPKENFVELCRKLSQKENCAITLFGGEKEKGLVAQIAAELGDCLHKPNIAVGRPIAEVMKLVREMDLFISNDTGLMHLASAYNIPVIAIFGPTHPKIGFSPLGANTHVFYSDIACSPCSRWGELNCRYKARQCFSATTTGNVLACAGSILDKL